MARSVDMPPNPSSATAAPPRPVAFLVVDRAGRCTQASAPAAAMLGLSVDALVGTELTDAAGATSPLPPPLAAALATALATQTPTTSTAHGVATVDALDCRILPSDGGAVVLFEPAPGDAPATSGNNGANGGNGTTHGNGGHARLTYGGPADLQLLDQLLETVPECIKVISADGIVVAMNAAGYDMLEGEPEAVLGRPADLLIAEVDRPAYRRVHEAVMRGEAQQVDLDILTLRGRTRRIEMRSVPLRDAAGRVVAELAVSHDITDRHRDAERLRASEARFRSLADSAPIGIFVGERDGRQIYANPRFAAIWHMPLEEAAGFGWRRRIHPDDREQVLAGGTAAFNEGHELRREHRILLDDGAVRWVRGHVVVLRDAAGAPTGSIGTIEDITERRAAAEAEGRALATADLQRALLDAVLEALPAGVIFADAEGRIVRATRQARLLWGGHIEAEGIADYGRYGSRLRGSDRPVPPEERMLARALRGEATPSREIEIDRIDGGTTTVLSAGAPVRDASGHIIGGVAVFTDVSERVRLELQLRQAQKMEAIGQLAGGIAHDFNNLLTVINGNVEFARNDLGPDHPVQQDLAEVAHAAERARTLVRQLLAFSRKQVVQARDVDLNEVVRGADNLLRRVLGEEIAFATTLAPEPAVVHADRGQLEQVLMNLAVNARDAMLTAAHGHPGTGGTLTIGTELVTLMPETAAEYAPLGTGRYVRLTVSDTGHGMDATTRAHIFEPFFTTKAVGAGTGLGLAMVYGIVVQAGGALRVDSAPGVGATFSIMLPAVAVAPERAAATGPTPLPRGHGTVLVVEDESAVRLTTRRVLERQGYAVLEARHGADALRVWREHRDHIVACVTDLRMPEMGGRELAMQLRADAPTLPVVYVSGYGEDADTAKGPHDAFVGKPFSAEALVTTLQRLVRLTGRRVG